MKVGIIGAGAMGSLYGGIFAEKGHEVWFIDVYQDHVNAINANGLTIVKEGKKRVINNIKATTNAEDVGHVDVAVIFVKSTITDIAVKSNASVFGPNTIVLTLQNGLGNIEKIESVVQKDQIIAGTSANGASFIEPGKINHAGWGGTTIGALDGNEGTALNAVANLLAQEELGELHISNNVMGLIWDKVLVNTGINALTALSRMQNGKLLEHKETEELLEQLVTEGKNVAEALGIQLSDNPVEKCKDVANATSSNISSMFSDVLHLRKTEIDNINGAIVREGEELGVDVPYNRIIWKLVKALENYEYDKK